MVASFDEIMIPRIRLIIFRKCTPEWEMPENTINEINLTYIIQGEARYTVNDQTINVAEGDLLLLPKGCVRKAITFPDRLMHCFSVAFSLKNTGDEELSLDMPQLFRAGRHEDLIRIFNELTFAWVDKQPGYITKCNGLLLLILHRFMEIVIRKGDSFTGDYRISKTIHYMAAHYSERITVKEMAQLAGLHPAYFGALFRQTIGMSLNQYLTQIRIKNAENMLGTGEYKVCSVAEACGFTDTAHFHKQFKLIKGFPPSHSLKKKQKD